MNAQPVRQLHASTERFGRALCHISLSDAYVRNYLATKEKFPDGASKRSSRPYGYGFADFDTTVKDGMQATPYTCRALHLAADDTLQPFRIVNWYWIHIACVNVSGLINMSGLINN